jgi:Zn-finger nucleic acid-binding protein
MRCPNCKEELKEKTFYGTKVDYCSSCKGYWFESDELRKAKDKKEEKINWVDVNLWKDEDNFKASEVGKKCPDCELPLYEINYGDSEIKIDVCKICEGVWLDNGEFRKIIKYLKEKSGEKIMEEYFKTLITEAGEVFVGPESLEEEMKDVSTVFSFLKYRIAGKHPFFSKIISEIPKV